SLVAPAADDCDDNDANEFPGQTWYAGVDADGDGFFGSITTTTACDQPTGYLLVAPAIDDCDDNDANEFPGQTWYAGVDNDGDGFFGSITTTTACEQPTGYLLVAPATDDCDDNDAAIYPNATEILCNGIDENCNGMEDDIDTIQPICITNDIIIELDEFGVASIVASDIDNGSTDNCSIVSMNVSPNSFDINDIGVNTVILTVTDGNNNSSQCTAIVEVTSNALMVEQELNNIENIDLYPNPFENKLTVRLPQGFLGDDIHIELVDMLGRTVLDLTKHNSNGKIEVVEFTNIEVASYFVKVTSLATNKFIIRKLVKK
ncbi:Por secretion system C-terminal sorting domain-containing protein, partial [Lutibacter oricola]